MTFSELNLYAHSLSDAFVDVSLFGKNLTVENAELLKPADTAGDVSTQGAVPKAWIRRDGQFYLLKDGGERDVNAELLAYETLEGGRCLTADRPVSQLEAARQGVRAVGLNQVCEVQREWFVSDLLWEMFRARLRELETI